VAMPDIASHAGRRPPPGRKPWETAVPVAQANRQWAKRRRASESLDDVPQDPRLPSYPPVGPPVSPTQRPHDLYGSLSALLGIRLTRTQLAEAIQ